MIEENILKIKKEIEQIAKETNRNPSDITLVAVTKGVSVDNIKAAINCGIFDIGENYIQEALPKYQEIKKWAEAEKKDIKITQHFIGHLQKNKVKFAVPTFDLIHSVDSLELAEEINKHSIKINKITNILLQVNISGEKTKFGIKKEDVFDNINNIIKLKNIKLLGFMTISPLVENEEETRWIFKDMYSLYKEIDEKIIKLKYLSMGMTQDYKVALQEGSNMIRIKTAIFGR